MFPGSEWQKSLVIEVEGRFGNWKKKVWGLGDLSLPFQVAVFTQLTKPKSKKSYYLNMVKLG